MYQKYLKSMTKRYSFFKVLDRATILLIFVWKYFFVMENKIHFLKSIIFFVIITKKTARAGKIKVYLVPLTGRHVDPPLQRNCSNIRKMRLPQKWPRAMWYFRARPPTPRLNCRKQDWHTIHAAHKPLLVLPLFSNMWLFPFTVPSKITFTSR